MAFFTFCRMTLFLQFHICKLLKTLFYNNSFSSNYIASRNLQNFSHDFFSYITDNWTWRFKFPSISARVESQNFILKFPEKKNCVSCKYSSRNDAFFTSSQVRSVRAFVVIILEVLVFPLAEKEKWSCEDSQQLLRGKIFSCNDVTRMWLFLNRKKIDKDSKSLGIFFALMLENYYYKINRIPLIDKNSYDKI